MDVLLWAQGSQEEIKKTVLTKLNAARARLYLPVRSLVPSNVSGQNYDYVSSWCASMASTAAVGRIHLPMSSET